MSLHLTFPGAETSMGATVQYLQISNVVDVAEHQRPTVQ